MLILLKNIDHVQGEGLKPYNRTDPIILNAARLIYKMTKIPPPSLAHILG